MQAGPPAAAAIGPESAYLQIQSLSKVYPTDDGPVRALDRVSIEQRLQPVVRPLGFRTAEFAWSRYAQWLAGARGMELAERRLVPPLGHFSLVRFRKVDVAKAA